MNSEAGNKACQNAGMSILCGTRVVELATLIAAPYCAMLLGEMGAEVIKVEQVPFGDPTRRLGPPSVGDQSALFISINRNKKSLAIDIQHPRGRALLRELIGSADVLVENLRPDAAKRAGLDYEALRSENEALIYCSFSAFGEEGPYKMKAGTDTIFQGMGGIMTVSGDEGDPPVRVGMTPADMAAALYGALGVVLALYHRQRTGQGQKVSLSLIDSLIAFQTSRIQEYFVTGKDPERTGRASPFACPAELFETSDGYIQIAVFTDKFWKRLCRAIGDEGLTEDPRFVNNQQRKINRAELSRILAARFRCKSTQQWRDILDSMDIPNGPVYTYSDMFCDPQIKQNGMVLQMIHPALGPLKLVGQPLNFSLTPARPGSHPPMLGEHTFEILEGLHYSKRDVDSLAGQKIVTCREEQGGA